MKKLVCTAAVTLGLLGSAFSAYALHINRAQSFYVAPNFGVYNTAGTRNMDSPIMGGIGAGYNFTNYWSAQAVVDFFNPTDNVGSKSHQASYFRAEGLFNLPTRTRVSPYFAAGLGYLTIKSGHFAPDLGFGIRVFPVNTASFGLNYRHIFQVSPARGDNIFYATVSFYFGNGAVVIQAPQNTQRMQAADKFRQESRYVLPVGFPPCTSAGEVGCIRLVGNKMNMNLDVKFANDKAVITSAYEPQLKSLGTFLNKYPKITLQINGYTSNTGTFQHNQNLSDRRASTVKQYLVSQYDINASRLTTKGWSWTHPVASNKTKAGQAENRRVEALATVPLKPKLVTVKG